MLTRNCWGKFWRRHIYMYHSMSIFELALNMGHTLLKDMTSIPTPSSTIISEAQYYKYQKRIAHLEQSLQKDVSF